MTDGLDTSGRSSRLTGALSLFASEQPRQVRDAATGQPVPGERTQEMVADHQLHHSTAALINRFLLAMAGKLAEAEAKHGYTDNWKRDDWQAELIRDLQEHVKKGDPRDVAAYCAFAWHHGWTISPATGWAPIDADRGEVVGPEGMVVICANDTGSGAKVGFPGQELWYGPDGFPLYPQPTHYLRGSQIPAKPKVQP